MHYFQHPPSSVILCHRLIGNEESYKRDKLDGTHRPCLDAAVAMAKQSILDLLTSSPQQWICSSCRFKDEHVAMLSVVPACPTCGVTLEDTVGIYTAMWMDGLTSSQLVT
jgi:hypothetical protein